MNTRQLFQRHLAPTSPAPIATHIVKAEGSRLWDADGKVYIDLIGGISVCNTGHRHPAVLQAIQKQMDAYLHVMVYGETIQSPQVYYAQALCEHLPPSLDCVYFTNSGAEATEGAIKLSRRITRRTHLLSAFHSYHGNTTGALAIMGDEYWKQAFRPLMPGVTQEIYNSPQFIKAITEQTAAVFIETVQAEKGVIEPNKDWILAVRQKCTETGALLVMDEIQCGFGRTGKLWGFEHYGVIPDILLLGKALGGGLPLGAFVAAHDHMQLLAHDPVLGHITTFGGHPLSCAAGMASLQVLLEPGGIEKVEGKAQLFTKQLVHPSIRTIRHKGLLMAIELEDSEGVIRVLAKANTLGLFSDWFLFAPECIRIAPPLNIADEDIVEACRLLQLAMD